MELREALSCIAEIRERAAATQQFRGYRAIPVGFSGVLAILAALLQPWIVTDPTTDRSVYLALWLGTAFLGIGSAGLGIIFRRRQGGNPLDHELTRIAVGQFLPCLTAGALITFVFVRHQPQMVMLLPGLWQIIFSLGMFASGRLLPRPISLVGLFYLASGVVNLARGDEALSPWGMGLPFAVGQLATGLILYWNLERHHGR